MQGFVVFYHLHRKVKKIVGVFYFLYFLYVIQLLTFRTRNRQKQLSAASQQIVKVEDTGIGDTNFLK